MAEGTAGQAGTIVNALEQALRDSVNAKMPAGVTISYGFPDTFDASAKSKSNEISIFLYDVHEDLSARHGEVRSYEPEKKRFSAGTVRLNYCFLITYWGPEVTATEAIRLKGLALGSADFVIQRLINLREIKAIPGSHCCVLPPSEGLSSLGSFWQALGNRPRLCLGFTVTAPMKLDVVDQGDIGMIRPF